MAKRILRKVWRGLVVLAQVIGGIYLLLMLGIVLALAFRPGPSMPDQAVLTLDLQGAILEEEPVVPLEELLLSGGESDAGGLLLRDIVLAIDQAREDDRVQGIALELDGLDYASISQMEEIGASLAAFRAAGKPVLSFGRGYDQLQYYLASHADQVYLDSSGHSFFNGVFFTGLSRYPLYFKGALEKLKIKVHAFTAGRYKDAVEVMLRDGMSEASREANAALLTSIWDGYVGGLGARRGLEPEQLASYIDNYGALLDSVGLEPAQLAEQQGLVDGVISEEDWQQLLADLTGSEDEPDLVSLQEYLAVVKPALPELDPSRPWVAVITLDGIIDVGESEGEIAGSDTLSALIQDARENESVAALVLRVNSPGGSADASELIRQELQLTQGSGKPVVISMGGVAASGGYWVSATANRIFASPATVTGSIGAFSLIPTLDASLLELGIQADGLGTTDLAGAFNLTRPLNPKLGSLMEQSIRHTYSSFVALVSEGRGLAAAETEALAQGRVWAGAAAAQSGLVDALGHTGDAIESAALLAGLDDYQVAYLSKELSPFEAFFHELARNMDTFLPTLPMAFKLPAELQLLLQQRREPAVLLQCNDCQVEL